MTGIDVEIPLDSTDAGRLEQSPTIEPPFAGPPRLPDILHFMVNTDPLPASTIAIGSESDR